MQEKLDAPAALADAVADPAERTAEPPPTPRLYDRMVRRFPALGATLDRFDARVTIIMSVAAVMLLVFKKFGASSYFEGELAWSSIRANPRSSVIGDFYWFLACFTMLGVIPLLTGLWTARLGDRDEVARGTIGDRLREMGVGLGDVRFGLTWVARLYFVMLPVIFIASRSATFSQYYPLNNQIGAQALTALSEKGLPGFWPWFFAYEILYAVYFIGWEFFFRGFLTLGVHKRLGFDAVLLANIPFVLMHAGKPFLEGLGSLIAGIALGLFAIRARSFWYCWLLHAAIAISMDLCAIERRLELMGS